MQNLPDAVRHQPIPEQPLAIIELAAAVSLQKIQMMFAYTNPPPENLMTQLREYLQADYFDFWFDPKTWENTALYEALGVRFFKKYQPISGDYICNAIRRQLPAPRPRTAEDLEEIAKDTRVFEAPHVLGLLMLAAVAAIQVARGDLSYAAFTTAINALVSLYPIMVQRYNRLRAEDLQEKRQNKYQEH